MRTYRVVVTLDAKADLKRYVNYLLYQKKSPEAANSVVLDFRTTRKQLQNIAGSIGEPESEKLRERQLKRINFTKHNYFLLFRVNGDTAFITNMFHAREDFENKLS